MQPLLILKLLVLMSIANGAPLIATRVLGRRLAQPLDFGIRFFDGRPLFGPSKTIRGVLLAILLTGICAPLLELEASAGLVVGAMAMAGDLFSSFVKRRLDLPSSSRATGLDQIPECLFPLLACRAMFALSLADIVVGVIVFSVGEVWLSRVFFRIGLRDRPY